MSGKRETIIQWVSFLAGAVILLQIIFILTRGESFCLNESCRLVEKLTTISPLYINLAGLLYFTALFGASRSFRNRSRTSLNPTFFLLILGLAVEGVLLSYQIFVIKTYCPYCFVIFTIIFGLNLLCGWQLLRFSIPLFVAVLASFAMLNFSPASILAHRSETLAAGTYAVKECANPLEKLYFFFSADCPHCKKVLAVLENCNNCEFHFNPIDTNQSLDIAGLTYNESYNPSLNRVVLSLLNITTIPVLLVQNQNGLTFIKGEESIVSFVSQACFSNQGEVGQDAPLPDNAQGTHDFDGQEGECIIELECSDNPDPGQSPYTP